MTGATANLTALAPITRRPLTIAVVARQFPVVSETFVLDHINGLLDCGHNVQVLRREIGNLGITHGDYDPARLGSRITTWIPARNRSARAINKLKLLPRMPLRAVPHLITGPMRADLVPLAAKILRLSPQPDLLHAHFGHIGEMLAVLRHHNVTQIPLVVSVHGFDVNRALAGSTAGFPHLFLQAACVIVTSAFMQRQTERLGCAPERIVRIPIGIDVSRFSFAPRQWRAPATLRLLTVARLVEQKGIARGILATAALIREGIAAHYTIVGDGPLRADLEQLARDCGIADFVDFCGA
ncbi:MAG: glycosyltransferase, partial [Pseudomonadota bacterium]|nr:glycosyltransferase [Pseudomonadota bacterium]